MYKEQDQHQICTYTHYYDVIVMDKNYTAMCRFLYAVVRVLVMNRAQHRKTAFTFILDSVFKSARIYLYQMGLRSTGDRAPAENVLRKLDFLPILKCGITLICRWKSFLSMARLCHVLLVHLSGAYLSIRCHPRYMRCNDCRS